MATVADDKGARGGGEAWEGARQWRHAVAMPGFAFIGRERGGEGSVVHMPSITATKGAGDDG